MPCEELTESQIEEVHELIKDVDEHLKQFNMMVDKFWGIK